MKNPERALLSIVAGLLAMLAVVILSGCGGPTVVQDRPVTTLRPVPQPCAKPRPAPVPPLKDRDNDWAMLDVKQKAALVAKQGLDLRAYGEQLNAATGACP